MGVFNQLKKILSPKNKSHSSQDLTPSGSQSDEELSKYGKQLIITEEDKQKKIAQLTNREYELYLLLLEGFTLKESADQLSIKYSTANTYMTGIYKKLGVNSRPVLIINYRHIKRTDM